MLPFVSLNNCCGCWMNLRATDGTLVLGERRAVFWFGFFFFFFLRGDCLASVYE